jgi:hypothetical protein
MPYASTRYKLENAMNRLYNTWSLSILTLVIAFLGLACGEDSPTNSTGPGEEELITTVKVTLTEVGTSTVLTIQFQDLDGPGGADGTVDTLRVKNGSTYNATVQILNEDETPAEDITEEVKDEAEEHMLWLTPTGGFAAAMVTRTDMESDYMPGQTNPDLEVGITFQLVVTNSAGDGSLMVALDHYDDVAKDGTNRSNETDIEVTFPVVVTP